MDEIIKPITQRTTDHRAGIVPGAAHFAIETVERTQATALSILQDVRGELRVTVDGALDLTEKALGAMLRIARKLTQRIDEAAAETLTGVDRMFSSTTRSARETTVAATQFARTAVDGVAGGARPASA